MKGAEAEKNLHKVAVSREIQNKGFNYFGNNTLQLKTLRNDTLKIQKGFQMLETLAMTSGPTWV